MEWVKSGPELAQRACHPFCDDWEVPTPRWTCEGDKEGRGGKKGEGTAAHGGMGIAEDAGGVRGGKGVHERSPAGDPVAGAQFLLLLALFPRRWVYSLRPAANARADVSSAPFSSRGSASSSSGSSDGVRVRTSPHQPVEVSLVAPQVAAVAKLAATPRPATPNGRSAK